MTLTRQEIKRHIKAMLVKYNAEYAILFGSYARDEADENSDIDVIIVGGESFHLTDILALGEDLRELTQKNVDAFEIREVNKNSELYQNILREGVRIA